NAMNQELDSSYTDRQDWLSPQWQEIVNYTILYADSIGFSCDLTMGTLWPFGDSNVKYKQASQSFGEKERQVINRSWEYPKNGYVVDHLNPDHYMDYFNRMLDSFPQPSTKNPQAYFIDSWEVETKKLWTDGIKDEFIDRFGYDISQYMDSLYEPQNKHRLYDYRKIISEKVIGFYTNYDKVLNDNNLFSRGQCSGAPCDIISAYARLDIPEGEAMLYEPEYNSIPASAALLSNKKVVSAESFTCLYGWPRNFIREEQSADLKMMADALFANGINQIVWHGKAHNPKDQDSINFYASVHIGEDGNLAPDIPAFNKYLEQVSSYMKKGKTYSDVAVYLPTEDAWIKGIMPVEKQFIWAWGYYEMRYIYFPEELSGYHPVWINREFLKNGKVIDNQLAVGDAIFKSLYLDTEFLDYETLKVISNLADQGLPVTLKNSPQQAGTLKSPEWDKMLTKIMSLKNVASEFIHPGKPLIEGENIPAFWARKNGSVLYIFLANPSSKKLKFPVKYGQSYTKNSCELPVKINYKRDSFNLNLKFNPYTSLLYKIENDTLEKLDISFIPKEPVIKEYDFDEKVPWKE
ncbi:MAG: glycosyl hydrolase, partial [Bacteroidota bacterium]